MSGYSGTPLVKKLGIKAGHRVVVVGAPPEFGPRTLGELPADVELVENERAGQADVLLYFVTRTAKLKQRLGPLKERIKQDGALWVCWPKKASGLGSDIVEDTVRLFALPIGLVDNKVCAIDEVWSGLRLVIRRELRKASDETKR